MQKKASLRKKSKNSAKQNPKKKQAFFSHLKKYIFFVGVAVVVFTLTSITLFTHHPKPTCANSKSCISDLSLRIENNVFGIFDGKKVYPPKVALSPEISSLAVLGDSTASGEKHIYVDLSTQTLVAYEGPKQILKTLVSTGRWAITPTGNFHVWEKLRSTRMAGGEGADAYDLPNVQYVMYFYNDFGLHAAYWHDDFGHTMSHGCVNMRQVDAKILYDWADGPNGSTPGTAVSICDQITNGNQCIQNNPIQ